jgi:hypothetical protein
LIMQGKMADAFRGRKWPEAPKWMQVSHHMFHSLPVLLLLATAIRLIRGHWPLWGVAWGLHILVDIPTHSRQDWAPQFLWPLSDITVSGVLWFRVVMSLVNRVFR